VDKLIASGCNRVSKLRLAVVEGAVGAGCLVVAGLDNWTAGFDEGILPLSIPIVAYADNPHSDSRWQ
jgi:hypothetical protein